MAITKIDVETFLSFGFQYPVLDVRSEGEYQHAHIPGAVSVPLFNNEERKIVGTAYKQESKQKAIKLGLAIFGRKMVQLVETVESLLHQLNSNSKTAAKAIVVHCWRGGMRSGGVAWLLDLYGFRVFTIIGGYKAYRRWSLQQLEKEYRLHVVGGFTGSNKTNVLHELKKLHHAVIDLENLARHKGSAFGNIEMIPQPSQEMFENLLALELKKAEDSGKLTDDRNELPSTVNNQLPIPIWLEDESQRIGLVTIPNAFYKLMRSQPVYFLEVPFELRLQHIIAGYGKADKKELINAIIRIQKRLGGLETKMAVNYLLEDNVKESFSILLKYYDKQYLKGLNSRENVNDPLLKLECATVDPVKNARCIIAKQLEKEHA